MEAARIPHLADQPISPYRHMKTPNPEKSSGALGFRAPTNIHAATSCLPPPPSSLSFSCAPSSSLFSHTAIPFQQHKQLRVQNLQPPLLPLPPGAISSHSPPPNKHRKSSKSKIVNGKDRPKSKAKLGSKPVAVSSEDIPSGPAPADLPKDFCRVFSSPTPPINAAVLISFNLSGSAVALSPPPSSLPLPTFSLKPRRSCNVDTTGIDAGATHNLRRLLRLPSFTSPRQKPQRFSTMRSQSKQTT